jgi:hypothetical protein
VTPLFEACVLPGVFLTVTVLGAIRPGGPETMTAPSPASLVVAVVLLGLLVQSGALDPNRLLNQSRPGLANLNGLSVLLTLFFATAAVLTLVVPESGLPALMSWTILIALLAQAMAMGPDRVRLLRGLMVTFGAAFMLKFIILAALSTPADSRVGQALQILFDGVTLGTIAQRPPHPAEGYLAFATLAVYLIGVAGLPATIWRKLPSGAPTERFEHRTTPPEIE